MRGVKMEESIILIGELSLRKEMLSFQHGISFTADKICFKKSQELTRIRFTEEIKILRRATFLNWLSMHFMFASDSLQISKFVPNSCQFHFIFVSRNMKFTFDYKFLQLISNNWVFMGSL